MRIKDVQKTLEACMKGGLPVLLTGSPGVGKSDIVTKAAEVIDADVIISHPVVADPTDAKGLPWVSADKESATFLPFGDLHQAIKATKKTVWFLDDLGQASAAVQASYMQLLLARRVNGHVLPDCVTFAAATNRRTDKAGVTGILEPVKSRFATILDVEPHLDDWCEWATKNGGIQEEIVGFLKFRPDLLSKFVASADMVQSPSPRTWKNLSNILKLDLPRAYEFEAMSGAVGAGAATEFQAYLQVFRAIPDLEGILKDPVKAVIPKETSSLFAVAVGLSYRANADTFAAICTYAQRLEKASKGEFAVLLLRDSVRRDLTLATSAEFKKLEKTGLSKLILDN